MRSTPGEAEHPKLAGAQVADLVAARPIGGDVALKLSPTSAGWTLDDWKIVQDYCGDALVVQLLEATDRCG